MEVGFLVSLARWALLWFCFSQVFVAGKTWAEADATASRQEIRFYKANRALQTERIWFTKKKGKRAGCHDFLKKTRVYKVVQFGYEQCTLYSQKSCAAGSEIIASHAKSTEPSMQLSQGYGWLPDTEHKRGAKLRSWSCP